MANTGDAVATKVAPADAGLLRNMADLFVVDAARDEAALEDPRCILALRLRALADPLDKITREDVGIVEMAAAFVRRRSAEVPTSSLAAAVEVVAAKLARLLPSE